MSRKYAVSIKYNESERDTISSEKIPYHRFHYTFKYAEQEEEKKHYDWFVKFPDRRLG